MKKKLISLVLCAAVCLTTGCGSKESSTPTNPAGNSLVNQITSTPSNSTPAVSTPAVENGNFVRGKWNGDVFTSDFFGFAMTLGSDWTKETDEQLATRNSITDMSDANFNSAVEKSTANSLVYEVFAQNPEIGSVGLAYNKYKNKTLDAYLQENANGIKMSSAFTDTRIDTVNIAGKEQDCIYTTFLSGTVKVKEIMIVYKNGDYFTLITIGVVTDDDLQDVVDKLFVSQTGTPGTDTPANSTPTVDNGKFVRGKWNGDVFTSDFFGIKVTLDDSCVKETDTQLAARNGIADMSDANFNSAVEKSNANMALYEMFLKYGQTGSFALAYNRYDGASLDDYVQANANGLKLSTAFKDIQVDKVNIGGKDQPCVYTTFTNGTAEIKEVMVMYKNGDYFAIVTIGATSDADLQNMIKTLLG